MATGTRADDRKSAKAKLIAGIMIVIATGSFSTSQAHRLKTLEKINAAEPVEYARLWNVKKS